MKEHRVYETAILPETAYLEMAIAAGAIVAKSKNLCLQDVVIAKALMLPKDEVKTVQVILIPKESSIYSFEIYSFASAADENNGKTSWILHASGKLLVNEKESLAHQLDLAILQQRCTQQILPESLYQRFQQQGMDYGSSFQGLEQIWRHEREALGKIRLPSELVSEVGEYQIHPVLLDTCLQVLEAISFDESQQNTYVPIGLERLILCGRPSVSMWSYARVRVEEDGERQQQLLSADLELFATSGELIAVLKGVQLKAVRREAMLGIPQESWENWLYTDFSVEIQGLHDQSRVLTQDRGDFLHNTLVSYPPVERQQLLESRLREQVAKVLGFSTAKLDRLESLTNLGLDSLMAINLRNRINNEMGVNLPVIKIIEGASISQLAELMLSQLALAEIITSASPSTKLDDDMEEILL